MRNLKIGIVSTAFALVSLKKAKPDYYKFEDSREDMTNDTSPT